MPQRFRWPRFRCTAAFTLADTGFCSAFGAGGGVAAPCAEVMAQHADHPAAFRNRCLPFRVTEVLFTLVTVPVFVVSVHGAGRRSGRVRGHVVAQRFCCLRFCFAAAFTLAGTGFRSAFGAGGCVAAPFTVVVADGRYFSALFLCGESAVCEGCLPGDLSRSLAGGGDIFCLSSFHLFPERMGRVVGADLPGLAQHAAVLVLAPGVGSLQPLVTGRRNLLPHLQGTGAALDQLQSFFRAGGFRQGCIPERMNQVFPREGILIRLCGQPVRIICIRELLPDAGPVRVHLIQGPEKGVCAGFVKPVDFAVNHDLTADKHFPGEEAQLFAAYGAEEALCSLAVHGDKSELLCRIAVIHGIPQLNLRAVAEDRGSAELIGGSGR